MVRSSLVSTGIGESRFNGLFGIGSMVGRHGIAVKPCNWFWMWADNWDGIDRLCTSADVNDKSLAISLLIWMSCGVVDDVDSVTGDDEIGGCVCCCCCCCWAMTNDCRVIGDCCCCCSRCNCAACVIAADGRDRFRFDSESHGLGAPGWRYDTCLRNASLLRDTCEHTLHAYLWRWRDIVLNKLNSLYFNEL